MKTAVAALLAVLAAASPASAQSLLGDGGGSPYDPPKRAAIRKRDHLQILVQEPTRAEAPAPGVRAIAAEVVDIRPNGVLVVQAILRRRVNGEDETVRLTGEVAEEAVARNAVRCERLANLSVTYEGRDGARSGVGGWLFGKLWPF